MSESESNCRYPDKLKDKPSKRTPEQIAECYLEAEGHHCEEK